MKVLLCFPQADKQTGLAIKRAFENLKHKIKAVDAKTKRIHIFKEAIKLNPDLIFCSRTKHLAEEIKKIKQKLKNTRICMWNVDTRASINQWKSLFPLINLCDYHFVVNEYHVATWNMRFKAKTIWLPQGLQDDVYKKPANITEEDRKKYSCDVSFAGNCIRKSAWRREFLNTIKQMGIKIKVWGADSKNRLYNEEHNKMVFFSKINLGMSRTYQNNVNKYVSVRNYKILGAGGFLLELWRPGFFDVFPYTGTAIYKNPNNLKEQIAYWLDHKGEREKVAETGYKWVHKNATYTDRIKRALRYIR